MKAPTRLMILSLMLLSLSVSAMALTIDVYPLHVQNNAGDNVSIVVRVTENSSPLSNMAVNFIANLGTLNSASTLTNASGYGRVFLTTTESGIATLNASVGSVSKIANITFSPLSPESIIISESKNPVTAGNITTVRIGMLDQFGNVNDTAEMTLNIKIEDVYGNVNETHIIRSPYALTHIKASNLTDTGKADIFVTNSTTSDQNITLTINSTIAGNINISVSSAGVTSSKEIEVKPAAPSRIDLQDEEYTVNTTSNVSVCIYDMYDNPVRDACVLFSATPPLSTPYNSPYEYNSLNLSNLNYITGIDGIAYTVFRTDKRAGENTIKITVANTSVSENITITGLADEVNKLLLTHTPAIAYANNEDIYKLTAQAVDQFFNPIKAEGTFIKEQVVFSSGTSSIPVPLNDKGKATIPFGPYPYVKNYNVGATYKNSSGYTNITNSTMLKFIASSNFSLEVYASPDTLITQDLTGNHESTVKVIAIDEWGHLLPGVNLTISTTNAMVGNFSNGGINTTTINATTNAVGKVTLKYVCSDVPGNTSIVATAGNVTASSLITVTNESFLSARIISVEPDNTDLTSGDVVNVTMLVSVEGDMQVTRPAASAMLVLDRSGSMDPDYYAGTPLDVVLVIDRSGSMDGEAMLDAKTAAKKFASHLVSNSRMGVVSFAASPFVVSSVDLELTPLNSSANLLLVNSSIDKLHAVGGTSMGEGMADANDMLINNGRSNSRKVMILLTDGLTNQGDDQKGTTAVDLAKENDITIYTIGLGSDIDESLLSSIASDTDGKYYSAPSSSDLISIYNSIAQDISDYDITNVEYGLEGFTPYSYVFDGEISIGDTYTLSFAGYDFDNVFDSSPYYGGTSAGECLIQVNGQNFKLIPSVKTISNSNKWSTYVYDISNYVHSGENAISFYDYYEYTGYRDYDDYYSYVDSDLGNNKVRNVAIFTNGNLIKSYTSETLLDGDGSTLSFDSPLSSDYFEDTFEINESLNDLKVELQWVHNYVNLDLQLISPSKRIYGIGYNDTGYYPGSDGKSEYIWINPISNSYPEDDDDSVETGTWTVRVTGSGLAGTEPFTISTYIDKKSAAKLSSHAFISSFDETRGDKAGLALYSYENLALTDTQTSYVYDNSIWTGYFTVPDIARYNFNVSWSDSASISAYLYDGTELLDSSGGTGTCEVSSLLQAGETYRVDIVKGAGSHTDTRFTVKVSASPLDTVMTAYYDGSSTPKFRTLDDSQWSLESSAGSVGAYPYFAVLESSPVRPEIMMATGDDERDVNVQIWNGLSWGSVSELSSYLYSNSRKGFDLKYEQLSGDAVVVYMNTNINVRVPRYQIWDGSSWNSASAVNSINTGAGNIGWVRLEADPNSDEMVLATLDSSNDIRAQVWNGNSWGNAISLTNSARTSSYQCFDVVYEQGTGRAMVVWADSSYIKYRIWSGNSWGSEQNLYSTSNAYWLKLAADPNSNKIILAYQDGFNAVYAFSWSGSSWSSRQSIGTNTGSTDRRSMDVEFEQSSGRALIVWGDSTSVPKYRMWTGSWGSALSASNIRGTTRWVQLTPDPSSNEIFLMTSDGSNDLNIQKWTGSSWNSALEVETSSSSTSECFDLVFNYQNDFAGSDQLSWSQWTGDVKSTLNDSLSHLANSVNTITADGLTAIDEGLFVANNELASVDGNSTIVLMTDGLDNAGYHSLLEEAYKAKENNTVIYAVGFGNNESEVDPILSEIANMTGGEYYFAPNSSVLKDIFKGIAEQITDFSADGPVLNVHIPRETTTNKWATVTYVQNSSNSTTGNRTYFIIPKYPARSNAEPTITTMSNRSVLTWQLPNLGIGEEWGIWYQMTVKSTGSSASTPLILPESNIVYTNSSNITVEENVVSGDRAPFSIQRDISMGNAIGSLILIPEKSLILINEPTKLKVYVKDTTGNGTIADINLYTNLGFFNDYKADHIIINVSNGTTLNFSSATAGNAFITAYVASNSSIWDDELLVIRPKGKISIS